jgi:hypothetical protein
MVNTAHNKSVACLRLFALQEEELMAIITEWLSTALQIPAEGGKMAVPAKRRKV